MASSEDVFIFHKWSFLLLKRLSSPPIICSDAHRYTRAAVGLYMKHIPANGAGRKE
jgi:hypothetical protein